MIQKATNFLKTKKTNLFIFFLLLAALFAACFFLVYEFLIKDIQRLSEEITKKKISLAQIDYNANHIATFQKDYQAVEADLPTLEKVVLSEDEFVNFVRSLEGIAIRFNLKQKIDLGNDSSSQESRDSSSEKKEEKESRGSLSFNIELEGTYSDLVRYLQSMESLESFPSLQKLSLSLRPKESEEGAGNIIRVQIKTQVYLENQK